MQRWRSEYGTELKTIAVVVILAIVAIVVVLSPLRNWFADNITSTSPLPDWIAAAALGALVGMGELIARYKDAPFRALLTSSAVMYVAINTAAAIGALFLIRAFGWEFGIGSQQGQSPSDVTVRITQVMVAGLGAMTLFRSSLFITRVGDEDVGVGPSAFLSAMLRACDTGVDRARAMVRANWVNEAMTGVSYAKASESLVQVSARLRQNLSVEDRQELQERAHAISTLTMTEHAKALSLGLLIMNYVGPGPLERAIEALGPEIREDDDPTDNSLKLSSSTAAGVPLRHHQDSGSSGGRI